ncbi:hypothetical protein D3C73_1370300 [compost metagenome]
MGGDEFVDVLGVVGKAELFEQGGKAVGWVFHVWLLGGLGDRCAVNREQARSYRGTRHLVGAWLAREGDVTDCAKFNDSTPAPPHAAPFSGIEACPYATG